MVFAGDDGGLFDAVELGEGGPVFAEFDAVAADFDLFVGTAAVAQSRQSALQSAETDPVRYMRVPGAPKGQGTNRDAVSAVRCQYPYPDAASGEIEFADHSEAVPGVASRRGRKTPPPGWVRRSVAHRGTGASGVCFWRAHMVVSVGP